MSEILSETTETVLKVKRNVTGVRCDVCEKIVPVNRGVVSRYFNVRTGHNDWGNDSCDSVESQDICPDCINKFVTEYLRDSVGTTRYIDIETSYARPYERWERE